MAKFDPKTVASYFAPHHQVHVVYPAIALLEGGLERRVLYMPKKVGERFEPKPLVPDQRVIANTYRDREVSHMSLLPITPAKDKSHSGHGCFIEDVDKCSEWPGTTRLQVIVFRLAPNHHHPKNIRVRIKRQTLTFTNEEDDEGKTHEVSLEKLIKWKENCYRPWLDDIFNLIFQATDRAVRNVQRNLGGTIDFPWKQARGTSVKEGLPKIVKILSAEDFNAMNESLPDDEKIEKCAVCDERYFESESVDGDSRPAMLKCSKKHIVHLGCLENWCERNGMQDAKCFWCRVNIVDESVAPLLKPNYLDLDAPFKPNPNFTEWENWERSCADLDRALICLRSGPLLTVNAPRILETLKLVLHGPDGSRGQDAGTHHDFAAAPELALIETAFATVLSEHDGRIIPMKTLSCSIMREIAQVTANEFLTSGLADHLPDHIVEGVRKDPNRVPTRPGFGMFVKTGLSRTLNFQLLRFCPGEIEGVCGPVEESGFHKHDGYRLFYRKEADELVYLGEEEKKDEEEEKEEFVLAPESQEQEGGDGEEFVLAREFLDEE